MIHLYPIQDADYVGASRKILFSDMVVHLILRYCIGRLRPLGQCSLCSFIIATAAATIFAILRVLGFLCTFKVPSKHIQLSCNLYELIFQISIEQTKLIDSLSPHYLNRHINKTVQTSTIFMFKKIYLSKIVHSHKNNVFSTKDSHAIYWQDSNKRFFLVNT